MASLVESVATLTTSHNQLVESVADLRRAVARLENRTSPEYIYAREHNALGRTPGHSLRPVPHPDTGILPAGPLPRTLGDLSTMGDRRVRALLQSYSVAPSSDQRERLEQLARILGCHLT